jgi:hypothetical protein
VGNFPERSTAWQAYSFPNPYRPIFRNSTGFERSVFAQVSAALWLAESKVKR